MKTNVLHDRANVHSPRGFLSESTFWIIMKFRRSHEFSWLLRKYLFQLLTCRLSNSYDVNLAKNCLDSWMKNNPNGQTHLAFGSLLIPHWKRLRKTRCRRDGHVSFLLDHDWFCSEKIREILWHHEVTKIRFEIIISQASHTFFSDEIFKSFFLINRYFSFLRYSYVLSIWKLTCLVCCLRKFEAVFMIMSWLTVYSLRSFNCYFN